MLNEAQIREEIAFLKRNLQLQHDLTAVSNTLLAGTERGMLGLPRDRRQSTEPDVYFKSKRLSMLLEWCNAVCHFYNLKVSGNKLICEAVCDYLRQEAMGINPSFVH